MRFKTTGTLTGYKSYNGTVDGTHHDNTKIYMLTTMDSERGRGECTVEYKWGTSNNADKLSAVPLPCNAELEMEMVTTGNKQSMIVIDVKPIVQKQG